MKRQAVFTSEAKIDLAEITVFLAEKVSATVARKVLKETKTAVAFLNQTPGAGHAREDLTDKPVKFWQVFSYLIIYDPAPRPIRILRVLHGNRNVSAILEDENI